MVAREDLLQDLLYLLQCTQWPPDHNDIVKLKSPPPKPARAPVPAPVPTPAHAAPQQEGQVSLVDVFVSSFAGEHNLLLQAQYEQVNPEPPAILPHAFLQPRSLPATPAAGGRPDALVKKAGELAAPQEGEQAPPHQEKPLPPLCTGTQRLLLQVLADAYHLQHQELSRLTHAAAARQGAVVTLRVTLETTGVAPPTIRGDLSLLRTSHARHLTSPFPPVYTAELPVENMWSQQLLVRFSRERIPPPDEGKTTKKLKTKKPPKLKIPSPSAVGAAGHGGDGGGGNEGGDGVDVKLSSGGKAEPHTPPPSPVDKRTATLQRGLKGIRKSFRKIKNKSKNQDNLKDLEEVKPPVVFIHPVPQTSTPVKNATSEEDLKIKSSSASPFLKFRSLRVKKSDATTLLRISKIRASVNKKTTLHRTDPTASPVVVSKEELIISSEPPLKSYRLNTTIQTVGSVEDESFDSTNPFSDTDEINDEKNPFSRSYLSASSVESCDPQRRPKSLRRSIRKTLSKMSGIKSKKKKTADVAPESPIVAGQTAVSRQLFLDPTDGGAKDSSSVILEEVQEETVPPAEPPTAVNEDNFEELKCRLINLKDISTRAPYSERLELLPQLQVLLSLRLDVQCTTKCSAFDLYRSAFSTLYTKHFVETLSLKMGAQSSATGMEGVDSTASVEVEALLKQVVVFCGLVPERVALARFLVLVEAATGQMGTPNTLTARRAVKKKSPTEPTLNAPPGQATDESASEFVYNQKSETILVSPAVLAQLLSTVSTGLLSDCFTVSEKNSAITSAVALCRWIIGHHLERLQTVFPVSGDDHTRANLTHSLRCLKAVEENPVLAEGYAADVAELGVPDLRASVVFAVRKYTELWVAALIRETTHRIDTAMMTAAPALQPAAPAAGSVQHGVQHEQQVVALPLQVPAMVEAMPAMLTNFVRNVRQFENNKQIAYLAELVEKRLGTYRSLPFVGAEVPTPMLTYQRDEQAPPDEDEVVEMSLRLKVVGLLMPVIVDYLDVAKHFYDPIFRTHYDLAFLDVCWTVLVGGAIALYRQIGARDVLRVSLVEPPLPHDVVPLAISAVWSLCESFSSINSLSEGVEAQPCEQLQLCMEDCVMAWLLLIAQRAKQQLDKDIKRINAKHKHEDNQDNRDDNNLRELVNDMVDFVKLVVEKTERLVWSGGACPPEMLRFLGSQLTYHLNSFWQSLYSDYCRAPAPPNTISRWACLVMSALCDLKEELSSALLRLDPSRTAMQEAHHVLSLMPYKAARKMCYEEMADVEVWVGQAAGGAGGGTLVHKLDRALAQVYEELGPSQPLVACLRDRVLDATQNHLDSITQEEEFLQLAAVLEALQQFFTSSILLEESLLQAEERWKEQLSLARERGLPLAELQHRYYSQRYQEQQLQLLEDQTSATMLLVNIVFVEGSGLFVSIVQSPSAACLAKAALKSISSTANNNNIGDASEDTGRSLRPPPAQKASNILSSMFKGVTSAGGVYVKAQLVPAEWFPDAPLDRKTSVCKEDPAVYDEEITYGSVRPDSPGVERGGFLLLRLKLTRRLRSQVMSEALVSLSDVPVLSPENRRSKPHTHLVLTRAAPLHSYESLNILRRRNDEVTRQFLQQLEHDNKGQAKAFMSASNASISSLW